MTTENNAVISAALDVLQLFQLMATDYLPRTHKQVCEMAIAHGHQWSAAKVHGMLTTLAAAQFLRQSDATKEWSVSPHVTVIAVNYYEHITRRAQGFLAEVAEVKSIAERMQ